MQLNIRQNFPNIPTEINREKGVGSILILRLGEGVGK